jgi:sec-independent protein translocase protein TatB
MFDSIGFPELLLIGIVALLVVGPKDLPLLMRKAGQWVKKLRGMADDFRHSFDDLARQAELDELRKEVEALKAMRPLEEIREELEKPMGPGLDFNSRIDLSGQPPAVVPEVAAGTPDPLVGTIDGGVYIDPPAEAPPKKARTRRKAADATQPETVDPARRALMERAGDAIPRATRKPKAAKTGQVAS